MTKKVFVCFFLCLFGLVFAQDFVTSPSTRQYKIDTVTYNIKGITREYALKKAVPVDTKKVFKTKEDLDLYLANLEQKILNQRVLERVNFDLDFNEVEGATIISVLLTINTVDTWNIIALPYPKYDSNNGFQLKLKGKDYNFFGSMQELNADVIYKITNDQKSELATNLNFTVPFSFFGYDMNWDNDFNITFPIGTVPQYTFTMGTNFALPFFNNSLIFGINEGININDRNENGLYLDDPYYFNSRFYLSYPIEICKISFFDSLTWTPSASIKTNGKPKGVSHADLKGVTYSWEHAISLGRIDWIGNFRQGLYSELGQQWSWNSYSDGKISSSIHSKTKAYYSFFDIFGLTSQLKAFYNFNNSISTNQGSTLRGILDKRIKTDTAIFLNVDMPVKIMHVNFPEITGIAWTKYISFDMHASTFFDMALTHDTLSDKLFSFKDGWYSCGLELIVFPMKMRSIYGRVSLGYDLRELVQNNFKSPTYAKRDGERTSELFIGIGLEY